MRRTGQREVIEWPSRWPHLTPPDFFFLVVCTESSTREEFLNQKKQYLINFPEINVEIYHIASKGAADNIILNMKRSILNILNTLLIITDHDALIWQSQYFFNRIVINQQLSSKVYIYIINILCQFHFISIFICGCKIILCNLRIIHYITNKET